MPYVLPGSEKFAHPDATITKRAYPDDYAAITIVPTNTGDKNVIISWAEMNGLTAIEEKGVIDVVKVGGQIWLMEQAFNVALYRAVFQDGTGFRSRVAPGADSRSVIQVSTVLKGHVQAVLGLDSRPQAHPYFHLGPETTTPLTPAQAAALYGETNSDGTGYSVGILCLDDGYLDTDLTADGISPDRVTFVGVDGATNQPSGNPNSAAGENKLDLCVTAQGNNLHIYFFKAPNTDNGIFDCANAILDDPRVDVGSCSWGSPASGWTGQTKAAWGQMMAKATKPFFVASGDGGPNDGTGNPMVDFPAAAVGMYCMGIGGTRLSYNGSTPEEGMWINPDGSGSGGGFSLDYTRPSWQPGSSAMRGVPDGVANGDPATGYYLIIGGKRVGPFGGTSAAAPMWARLTAIAFATLGSTIPNFVPMMYANAKTFNAVTAGIPGEYGAPGQVAGAGLGSPNMTKLIAALKPTQPTETINVSLSASPTNPTVGQQVTIGTLVTGVPSGNAVSYTWSLAGASGPEIKVTYNTADTYDVSCVVKDTVTGVTGLGSVSIVVSAPQTGGPLEQFGQFVIDAAQFIDNNPEQAAAQAQELVSGAQAWMADFVAWDALLPHVAHDVKGVVHFPKPPSA